MKTVRTLLALALAAALAAALVAAGLVVHRISDRDAESQASFGPPPTPSSDASPADGTAGESDGFLYGRVVTDEGETFTGRLRWGGREEAFWDDYFNGFKEVNPWAPLAPAEHLKERRSFGAFGVEIVGWDRDIELGRPFMARFGDISRIEVLGRELRVTLKSGTVFDLDRFNADDIADGLRVWDDDHGVVDLVEWRIRSVELLPTPPLDVVPRRLRGTVRTAHGEFTGFVQWDRRASVGSDELRGEVEGIDDDETRLRFDVIRSIERSPEGVVVTLDGGSELELSGTRDAGEGHRGVSVDDARYGRVLIRWNAFERVEFHHGPDRAGSGPAYDEFPPGQPLVGTVATRSGRRLAGRLVFDLDESETTETLDAPAHGVNYTIPFARIASIELVTSELGMDHCGLPAVVTLRGEQAGGDTLRLGWAGDLGAGNAGLLIFVDDDQQPEYVPWSDIERIDFDPIL